MHAEWGLAGRSRAILAAITFAVAISSLVATSQAISQESQPARAESLSGERREELKQQLQVLEAQIAEFEKRRDLNDPKSRAEWDSFLKREINLLEQLEPDGGDAASRTKVVEKYLLVSANWWDLKDVAKCTEAARQAHQACERLFPPKQYPDGHPLTARCYFHVGRAAWMSKDFAESEKWHSACLKMRRKLFRDEKSPKELLALGDSLYWVGVLRDERGAPKEAKQFLLESVDIFGKFRELTVKDKSFDKIQYIVDLADWYDDAIKRLGAICDKLGDLDGAIRWYEQANELLSEIYEFNQGPVVPDRAVRTRRDIASVYYRKGNMGEAIRFSKFAMEMAESPENLAVCLNDLSNFERLAGHFISGKRYAERALEIQRQLYPVEKYPDGTAPLAISLNSYGLVLIELGDLKGARRNLELGLEIRRKLLAREPTSQNRQYLAISVNGMAEFLRIIGEGEEAVRHSEEAVALIREVYPKDRFPAGHRAVANCYYFLAVSQMHVGEYVAAAESAQFAVDMFEAMLAANIPVSRRVWAGTLSELGEIYDELGKHGEANQCHQKALRMFNELHSNSLDPQGRKDQAMCQQKIAESLFKQNRFQEAREYAKRALELTRQDYSAEIFPHGTLDLAQMLAYDGLTRHATQDYAGSAAAYAESIRVQQKLAEYQLPGLSEAESLNYISLNLVLRGVFFEAWLKAQRDPAELYEIVWNRRSLVMRLLQQRNLAIRSAASPQSEQAYREFEQANRELSKALVAGAAGENLAKLTAQKEAKEVAMLQSIPDSQKLLSQTRRSFRELIQQLTPDIAYVEIAATANASGPSAAYIAFVLRTGQPPVIVSLGKAMSIDPVVVALRTAITEGRSVSTEAQALRQLIWEPIEKTFPTGIATVYICPAGLLTAVPWNMLPGRRENTVLLEDYTLAVVPSGHLLLEQLVTSQGETKEPGSALIIGDLAFDAPSNGSAASSHLNLRSAVRGDKDLQWNPLPATARELDGILAINQDREISTLRGIDAPLSRVLQELPRARWAHFATHGYFADPEFRAFSISFNAPDQKRRIIRRSSAAARNPQLLSGIVLSGANNAYGTDASDLDHNEAGILTAEAISMLSLEQLQLVVLSACETGVGDVADCEGVLGLQRAFHMGGARNVVASLWKVDDRATAVLMKLFYENYWKQGKPPLVALRDAQLTLYRHPELIEKSEDRPRAVTVTKSEPAKKDGRLTTTDPRLWAAFTLSGRGD
jgi:CHAT domain-containing protein